MEDLLSKEVDLSLRYAVETRWRVFLPIPQHSHDHYPYNYHLLSTILMLVIQSGSALPAIFLTGLCRHQKSQLMHSTHMHSVNGAH